jgi:hypothetical protein
MKRLALFLWLVLVAVPAHAQKTFGLVIGIDEYTYVSDLHGAVNDAEDIADALTALGGEVTLLLNETATREAILGAWENILTEAGPGDRLIVSYAGHGSNEPEHTPGNEKDGRDENFLLAGYAPHGEAAAQRIRDDEIADLLHRSAALDVIFVADACHAGTVTRNLNPTLGYRYVTPEELSGDPLPPPPPPPGTGEAGDVALFLAAVNETQKVPEVLIDGTPRGALSYAFANGLRGAADLDGDARITKGELELHVLRTVRQISDGAQLPQSAPAGQEHRALIALRTLSVSEVPDIKDDPVAETLLPFQKLPPMAVSGKGWSGVSGVAQSTAGTLRLEGQVVYSSVGDRVAVAPIASQLQGVVDKHRLAAALGRNADPRMTIRFDKGDRTYGAGQRLVIDVEGRLTQQLTLISLDATGKMTFLYPDTSFGDPELISVAEPIALSVVVTPPFGADHVIAIETTTETETFRREIARLSGLQDAAALWDVLRHSGGRIAIFPFFTAGDAL